MSAELVPATAASLRRIPSLDGLRALSIFLVVALHSIQRFAATHDISNHKVLVGFLKAIFDGDTGVFIFFVISGYLITSLLLHEHQKRGSISLRGFYFRRAMRILPPLYTYVGFLLLLGWAGKLKIVWLDIVSALFFFRDYVAGGMWSLGHFWTLSIEEQFYFLWPFLLLYTLRKPGLEGRIKASKIAIAIILIEPFIRVAFFILARRAFLQTDFAYAFHTHADSLMFGCLIALLQGTPAFERFYAAATRIWWLPPTVIVLSDLLNFLFLNAWRLPFGYTINGVAIALFLLWCVRNPHSPLGRLLNSRFIVHIGVLSYSIYIWQTLFLNHGNIALFGSSLKLLCTLPFSWLAILAVAELSHYLIEQPSLRLRDTLIKRFRLYSEKRKPLTTSAPTTTI